MPKFCLRLLVAALFFSFAGNAFAEGFALYDWSARGVALGGAMVARKPDASAVAYNPALLARLPGVHAQAGVTVLAPSGHMWTKEGQREETTELRKSEWFIPNLYYTHQINDSLTFGIGEFTRFGLGFEYPHAWPGRYNIYEVNLTSGSLNPNLAWRATDNLSLAAGVDITYVDLDLRKRARVPLPYGQTPVTGMLEVDANIDKAEAFGVGFNLAGHYQFNDQWAVGLTYRSPVRVHAKGDMTYTHISDSGHPMAETAFNNNFHNGTASATVVLPESVSCGVSWSPVPELSIEAGAVWTRWSRFRSLRIHLPEPITVSESHKNWKDAMRYNVGIEYEPLDWLALRLGYVYDESPMTAPDQDYLVPTADRSIYSAGLGFKFDQWTVDLAYGYIDAKNRSFTARTIDGVLNSHTRNLKTHMISASIGYEF